MLVLERRFLLGVVVLFGTAVVALALGDTPGRHGIYTIPSLIGAWLLWAPVRGLLWGEGTDDVDELAAERELRRNNAAVEARTAHLSRVRGELRVGDRVYHDHFGVGVVSACTDDPGWVLIRFEGSPKDRRMSPRHTALWFAER